MQLALYTHFPLLSCLNKTNPFFLSVYHLLAGFYLLEAGGWEESLGVQPLRVALEKKSAASRARAHMDSPVKIALLYLPSEKDSKGALASFKTPTGTATPSAPKKELAWNNRKAAIFFLSWLKRLLLQWGMKEDSDNAKE